MTNFHPNNIGLSDGQLEKLNRAVSSNQAVSLRLEPENLTEKHKLLLTQTQINKINKATGRNRN